MSLMIKIFRLVSQFEGLRLKELSCQYTRADYHFAIGVKRKKTAKKSLRLDSTEVIDSSVVKYIHQQN